MKSNLLFFFYSISLILYSTHNCQIHCCDTFFAFFPLFQFYTFCLGQWRVLSGFCMLYYVSLRFHSMQISKLSISFLERIICCCLFVCFSTVNCYSTLHETTYHIYEGLFLGFLFYFFYQFFVFVQASVFYDSCFLLSSRISKFQSSVCFLFIFLALYFPIRFHINFMIYLSIWK